MSEFQSSPFDELILSSDRQTTSIKLNRFIGWQAKILRVAFNRLKKNDLGKMTLQLENGQSQLSEQNWASLSDGSITINLDYYSFINQVNQLGRVLIKEYQCSPPPRYYWIRLFRNKVIEHWDDYLHLRSGSGATQQGGKIAVPLTQAAISFERSQKVRKDIQNTLSAKGLSITIDASSYDDSSNIYLTLEKLWPKLSTKHCDELETISEMIFTIGFPLPFTDVEKYSSDLACYLTDLTSNR